MKELSFDNYIVSIAESNETDEIINLIQSSYEKNNPLWILFQIKYPKKDIINVVNNGRLFIIRDKISDTIVGCTKSEDILDFVHNTNNDVHDDTGNKHVNEIWAHCFNTTYKYALNKHNNKFLYGDCLYSGCTATKHGLKNMAFTFIYSLINYFMYEYIGYNAMIGELANKKLATMVRALGADMIEQIDFSNHQFKDKTHINEYFIKLQKQKKNGNDNNHNKNHKKKSSNNKQNNIDYTEMENGFLFDDDNHNINNNINSISDNDMAGGFLIENEHKNEYKNEYKINNDKTEMSEDESDNEFATRPLMHVNDNNNNDSSSENIEYNIDSSLYKRLSEANQFHKFPKDVSKMTAEDIAQLPASMQFEIMSKRREILRSKTRPEFFEASRNPSDYAQLQLKNFLKTSSLNQKIEFLRKKIAQEFNQQLINENINNNNNNN
eukprot:123368_1